MKMTQTIYSILWGSRELWWTIKSQECIQILSLKARLTLFNCKPLNLASWMLRTSTLSNFNQSFLIKITIPSLTTTFKMGLMMFSFLIQKWPTRKPFSSGKRTSMNNRREFILATMSISSSLEIMKLMTKILMITVCTTANLV